MVCQIVDFLLVQIEFLQHARIGEHLLGVRLTGDVPHHVVEPGVRNHRELEFVEVAPEYVRAGAVEMFRAPIGVETVCQTVANGEDVSARSSGGFEYCDFVPAPHEFVSAAEAANAGSGHDDLLRPAGLGSRRADGNAGGGDASHQLFEKVAPGYGFHKGEA